MRTIRSGGTEHTEASVLQLITDLITSSGVLDLSADDHFLITAQTPTPTMDLDVAPGRAYIVNEGGNAYPIYSTATQQVTMPANSSGNPVINSVVLYLDMSESPNTDSSNIALLAVVTGTSAASPDAPDDTAIASEIGAGNPYFVLYDVRVESGATSINNSKLTDRRVAVGMRLRPTRGRIPASSNNTFTTATVADITGATVTLVLSKDSYVDVIGIFDVQATVGGGEFNGLLNVDGVDDPHVAFYRAINNNERLPIVMTWGLTLAAGTHTIKLRGTNVNATGQFDTTTGMTGFTYLVTSQ